MKDDAALVEVALSGDLEAFGPIIERYQDAVFGVALSRLRNFSDAEDVAQDVFIEAFEHLGRLEDPSRLGAWLRSVAIHRSIDHLRQRRERVDVEQIAEQIEDPSTPHTELERRELRDQVMAAIGRLSKVQRETITLFYANGYSQEEIARIQEVPIGTVRRRLHDAREKLKEEMVNMVEEVLKGEAPKEDFAARVFELLSRYPHKPFNWQVITELRKLETPGIEGFIRAFALPHARTRTWTIHMLSHTSPQNTEVVVELLKKGLRDSSKKVRRSAAMALLSMDVSEERKRKDFIPWVVPLLLDRSKRVRGILPWILKPWVADVPLDTVTCAFLNERDPDLRSRMEGLLRAVVEAQKSAGEQG